MKRFYRTFLLGLIYVVIFNVLITAATVLLHEISHFLVAIYSGCKEIKIVLIEYPNLKAYTEMICLPNTQYIFSGVAPLILITLFGLLFLSLEKLPEKNFCWIIIGFNFIISISDILHFMPSILIYSQLIGVLVVVSGEFLFINDIILVFMKRRGRNK